MTWVGADGSHSIGYRPVNLHTLTNEVEPVPPKARVLKIQKPPVNGGFLFLCSIVEVFSNEYTFPFSNRFSLCDFFSGPASAEGLKLSSLM